MVYHRELFGCLTFENMYFERNETSLFGKLLLCFEHWRLDLATVKSTNTRRKMLKVIVDGFCETYFEFNMFYKLFERRP